MKTVLLRNWRALNLFQVLLDLVIVFIGVYAAFYVSSDRADKQQRQEAQRVVELLTVGMDRYEKLFEGFVLYHDDHNAEFLEQLQNGKIPDISNQYYPAPQYPIEVINFILTAESYKVFDLDFYLSLTAFANAMKRMMYVEEKLVTLSDAYDPLPPEGSPEYREAHKDQFEVARKSYRYMEIRKNVAEELSEKAAGLLEQLSDMKDG